MEIITSLNDDLLKAAQDENTTPQMIQDLIKSGADVNAKDKISRTALMFAAKRNSNVEVIENLINAGADINAKDIDGKSALDYAQNEEIRKIILNSAQ